MTRPTCKLEDNVSAFNSDTMQHGGYVYTAIDRWSSRYATQRQTDEIVRMLREHVSQSSCLTDIGCGDGYFTLELARRFAPHAIRGVDPAERAIEAARQRPSEPMGTVVSFETGSIYDIVSKGENVAVLRGVLHHLDRPQEAIQRLADQFPMVLALEPNGFNPVMKLIERTSAYHRAHDEKSYWPPKLNGWFRDAGFSLVARKFFCLVPYFCPTPAARVLRAIEPIVEMAPLLRELACGTNLALYRR